MYIHLYMIWKYEIKNCTKKLVYFFPIVLGYSNRLWYKYYQLSEYGKCFQEISIFDECVSHTLKILLLLIYFFNIYNMW